MESARVATRTDVDAITALVAAALEETAAKRSGPAFLSSEARSSRAGGAAPSLSAAIEDPDVLVVVGQIDDVVVGFGSVEVVEHADATRSASIVDLFVEDGARGIGVGEAMIELLVDHARALGCDRVDAFALPGDRATKNFFETSGFTARLLVMHRKLR